MTRVREDKTRMARITCRHDALACGWLNTPSNFTPLPLAFINLSKLYTGSFLCVLAILYCNIDVQWFMFSIPGRRYLLSPIALARSWVEIVTPTYWLAYVMSE
jgi:hypothetical protein